MSRPTPPQLDALLQTATRLRQGVVDKSTSINQFNTTIKERIRVLDEMSVKILEKLRDLCKKAFDCKQIISEKVAKITDLSLKLEAATEAQRKSAEEIKQLSEELNRIRNDAAQTESLRRELTALQEQVKNQTEDINSLTQGIDKANGTIGEALNELNKTNDTTELETFLGQLETHIKEIDADSNCASTTGNGNENGNGETTRPETAETNRSGSLGNSPSAFSLNFEPNSGPNSPAKESEGRRGSPMFTASQARLEQRSPFQVRNINSPAKTGRFGGKRKTKRVKKTSRKTKNNRR